jgi:hypothetical protein
MAVTDFPTKIAVVVRDDLAVWQRVNVCAFVVSGIAARDPDVVGEDFEDADGVRYLPMFRQPVLVLEAPGERLRTVLRRAGEREVPVAVFTADLFATGRDEENRGAVRSVPTAQLDLVGLGLRAAHRDADAVLRGLRRHP